MATHRTLTMVLGGGRGTRLYPLTALRAKPAVPLGGKYRLIDIPISNAIHSGMREIYVLTQFNSRSLNAHVARTYRFDSFSFGFVEVLAAQQTDDSREWFQGTADAIRQNLPYLQRPGHDVDVVILSGDHLYRMDYSALVQRHRQARADVTVACIPRTRQACEGFGVMSVDGAGHITGFKEKPANDEDISHLRAPDSLQEEWQLGERSFLASMGVYVFKLKALEALLDDPQMIDFGRHVIPAALEDRVVAAHVFDDYWEDIGTMASFYEANLMLCGEDSPFRFHTASRPIYTRARFLPGSRFRDAVVRCSIVSDGCIIQGALVEHSVIGIRTRLSPGSKVVDSVVMGADFYEEDDDRETVEWEGGVPVGIGPGVSIRRAIVDKNARIGEGVVIHGDPAREDEDHSDEGWCVRDGIIVVQKNAVIPAGRVL